MNTNITIKSFTVNGKPAVSSLILNEPVDENISINGVDYSESISEIQLYGWGYNPTASGNVSYIMFFTKEGLPEVGDEGLAFGENGGYFPRATTQTVTSVSAEDNTFVAESGVDSRTYERLERYDFKITL